MTEIKLKHDVVMSHLDKVKTTLGKLSLPEPGSVGQNKLDFTEGWLEREAAIKKNVSEYMKVVEKNVEDTRASVDLLKRQDEAMVRK
ncbi:hypothetical protein EV207_103107 [Scopulibacillus darangshiensis]|uniref:YwqI/YxiC family protein n=1 Tax=Scopulibacillus darangshiensis TaxID=442528 RepID=A0A4R2PAC8_9BACL|nr:DUF5344 family protein [Scopulibacillus darangshiensis]TCP31224.1 hypothetical protein EV207_103107 [Scopulibacillus darangshiensis]